MIKLVVTTLLISTSLFANTNFWLGFGVLGQSKQDYERTEESSHKMLTWGIGESFWNNNLVYFESGLGVERNLSDGAKSRTSFIKIGYELYFDLEVFYPYMGLGYGYFIRTISAAKRSSNYSPSDNPVDYSVTGTKKRSSLSRMYSGTIGTRFLAGVVDNMSLDFNAITLIYNGKRIRRYTGLNVVYIFGGR
jgi:hypothetical protein